jgi:small-conductance mechanosensitive channel
MGDDIAAAKRVILGVARGAEGVLPDPPPVVRVAEIGDFAVQLDLMVWVDPPQRREALDVVDRVLEGGKAALLEAGIDLPYPTQQVLFHDQTEATDGDRAHQREGWPARPGRRNPLPRWQAANDEAGAAPARADEGGRDRAAR